MQENELQLAAIRAFPGVEDMGIDFCLGFDPSDASKSADLSRDVIAAAGALGLSIQVSVYAVSQDEAAAASRSSKRSQIKHLAERESA